VPSAADPASTRLDKWLWSVRLFRTRSLATDACRAGSVAVGGQAAKPAREIRAGETVSVRQGLVTRTLVVRAAPARRVAAWQVAAYVDDRTPAEEFARAQSRPVEHFLAREKGSGRPTKRDRRQLERVFPG